MLSFQRVEWFFRLVERTANPLTSPDADYVVYHTNFGNTRASQQWMIPGTYGGS